MSVPLLVVGAVFDLENTDEVRAASIKGELSIDESMVMSKHVTVGDRFDRGVVQVEGPFKKKKTNAYNERNSGGSIRNKMLGNERKKRGNTSTNAGIGERIESVGRALDEIGDRNPVHKTIELGNGGNERNAST